MKHLIRLVIASIFMLTIPFAMASDYRPAGGGGGTPGGSDTQLQFNNSGEFGGDSDLTFTGGNLLTTPNIKPQADSTYDIGTSAVRFTGIYADTLYGALSASGSPENSRYMEFLREAATSSGPSEGDNSGYGTTRLFCRQQTGVASGGRCYTLQSNAGSGTVRELIAQIDDGPVLINASDNTDNLPADGTAGLIPRLGNVKSGGADVPGSLDLMFNDTIDSTYTVYPPQANKLNGLITKMVTVEVTNNTTNLQTVSELTTKLEQNHFWSLTGVIIAGGGSGSDELIWKISCSTMTGMSGTLYVAKQDEVGGGSEENAFTVALGTETSELSQGGAKTWYIPITGVIETKVDADCELKFEYKLDGGSTAYAIKPSTWWRLTKIKEAS